MTDGPHAKRGGLPAGVYEDVLTTALEERLAGLLEKQFAIKAPLPAAEAPDRLALHLAHAVRRVLADLPDHDKSHTSAQVISALLRQLEVEVDDPSRYSAQPDLPAGDPTILRGILQRNPDGTEPTIHLPLTPLLDTTVLTNSKGDRNLSAHLKSEVYTASGVDMIVAFIRRPGITPLMDVLKAAMLRGAPVRVLTTSFTGFTEREALDLLADAGAEVRVSYDESASRLHAKAWIFHRPGLASTAYLGSSNATAHGLVSGLEWNVRLSQRRNPDAVDKLGKAFDSYWASGDFVPFDSAEFAQHTADRSQPDADVQFFDIRPHPFQERMLEQLAVAREAGHHRNLLVSATGTGKTVMAALDYAGLRDVLPSSRLLFVAHREEILDQSLKTFRMVLRDAAFGEKWVGRHKARTFTHVFASIQSLSRSGLGDLEPQHFDVVIVDEFHHAAAASYQGLLRLVQPRELLGMTATPERADGLSVTELFDGRIAAEMRLWDAIAEGRLVPFQYFAFHDGVSLVDVPWRRGRGYDLEGLTNVYTSDDAWVRFVLARTHEQVDIRTMRALGFCVSVAHAQFMARRFSEAGVAAVAVSGESAEADRRDALSKLEKGTINVVFSVDLFNEGVDIPHIDTILLLRPTESATLFLQQLGRGLRRADGKHLCTVLDFVSQHRREFRFDQKMRALVGGGTRRALEREIEQGFPGLPPGVSVTLDPVAQEMILASIRNALPSSWPQYTTELKRYIQDGHEPVLGPFLTESGLGLDAIYSNNRSFSDLLEAAGVPTLVSGPHERALRRAIGRLLHVDDRERLGLYRLWLAGPAPDIGSFSERHRRLLRMLVAQVTEQAISRSDDLKTATAHLWQHPQVLAELAELSEVLAEEVNHLHPVLQGFPDSPLLIHAVYSRIEIQAALNDGDRAVVPTWREGVRWFAAERADAFLVTINKAEGAFSPTTAYRDFALSRDLFHWESQSTTSAESPVGLRYQRHEAEGSSVLLFARLTSSDRHFLFLGPATYVSHESSRPMAITWRLDHPIPVDVLPDYMAVGAA